MNASWTHISHGSLETAALAAASAHHGVRIGLPLLAVLVLGAVGYGATRLGRRRRGRGQGEDSAWLPERQGLSSTGGPVPSGDPAGAQVPAGPPSPQPVAQDLSARSPELTGPEERAHPAGTAASRPARAVDLPGGSAGGWAVETHGLTKRFGANVAVDDVELFVPRGSAFGYLGPNGAGKPTLIRTLLGLTRADGGTMALLGVPVPGQRSRALARVGAIVDEPRFHGHLTGRENLHILAAARGGGAENQIAPALDRPRLTGRADDNASAYPMGIPQPLAPPASLLAAPQLL